MKKLILLSILFFFIIFYSPAQQWSYQAGGYGQGINMMDFYKVNDQLLFIQANPMLRSEDGGNTWKYISHEGDIYTTTKPSFINSSTGWCGGAKIDINSSKPGPFGPPYLPQVLYTMNGGKNWIALEVSGLQGLSMPKVIHFFDASNGILAGETIDFETLLYKTGDGGRTWTRKFFSKDLFSVVGGEFVTSDIGYFSTSKGVLKTTDAGETWQLLPTPADPAKNQVIYKQHFISPTIGWVAGGGNLLAKTSDGGTTWATVASGFDENGTVNESDIYITGLRFSNDAEGYISMADGKLHFTEDGGNTWHDRTPENILFDYHQDILMMEDADHIFFATRGEAILYSADAGKTWENKLDPLKQEMGLLDVAFANNSKGWAVGYNGTLLHTLDGGAHWQHAQPPAWENETQSWQDIESIAVQGENTAWAVGGNGLMLHTTDGVNWTARTVGRKRFKDIFFLKGTNQGWAVGEDYTLLHYNGTDWTPQVESREEMPSLHTIFFLNENDGWAAGEKGIILKTENGGKTWAPQNSGILRDLNDLYFVNEQTGYAVGNNDYILKTTDGGETWRYQVIPHAFVGNMEAVYFSSPHRGWVAGSDEQRGAIYFTTDGGYTWKRTPIFGASMKGLYFTDLNHGWATDVGGKIYHFSDEATGEGDETRTPPVMSFEPYTDTLFNFDRSKRVLIDSTNQYGKPFLGKNGSGYEEFAEKYYSEGEAWIAGVVVYHHGKVVHGDNIAEYNVFSIDGSGYPDRKIGRKDIYFGDIDLSEKAAKVFFNEPIAVKDSFFVSFNLTDYFHGGFDGDDIGILHTSDNTRQAEDPETRNVVRVHDHSDRVWRPIVKAHATKDYNGHLAIFPILYRKDVATAVEDQEREERGLTLLSSYPNPAKGRLNIAYSLKHPSHVSIAVYDMNGNNVFQQHSINRPAGIHEEQIDVNTLRPGLYLYKIQTGYAGLAAKFMVIQ